MESYTTGPALAAGWSRGAVCMVLATLLTSGCATLRYGSPIHSQVLDARTGQRLAGAVAVAVWTRREGFFGLYSTHLVAVQEAETDADGRFALKRPEVAWDEDGERITVYKFGYLAWNNQSIGPMQGLRKDYRVPSAISLETFPDGLSHRDHVSFVEMSVMPTSEIESIPKMRKALQPEWETMLREPAGRPTPVRPTPLPGARVPPSARPPGRADLDSLLEKLKATDPKIRREAADTLGETGIRAATDHLLPLLKDTDRYARQAAARALGKLKDGRAVESLLVSLNDPDQYVRAAAIWAVGELQDPRGLEPLVASLVLDTDRELQEHRFQAVRKYRDLASRRKILQTLIPEARDHSSAYLALSRLIILEGKDAVLGPLEDSGGDKAQTVRNYIQLMETLWNPVGDLGQAALQQYPDRSLVVDELSQVIVSRMNTHLGSIRSIALLGELKDRRGLPALLAVLEAGDLSSRSVAASALGEIGDREAVEPLLRALADPGGYRGVRRTAAVALGKLQDPRAVEPLLRVLGNKREDLEVREGAALALGDLRDRRAVEPLINVLKEHPTSGFLEAQAVRSLGMIGDDRAVLPIQDAARRDRSGYVRSAAEEALKKLK